MSKKDHAIHNENACNFLQADKNYSDWVVTTAFYSALHYVQHEIFPVTINGKLYSSFNQYYLGHYRNSQNRPNRHVSTINLVLEELGSDAHVNYKWLYDLCMTSRYRNYNTAPILAEESIKRLQRIKKVLKK